MTHPDSAPSVLPAAPISTFRVRDERDAWVVEDATRNVGGIFVSREAVRAFVARSTLDRGGPTVIEWRDGTRETLDRSRT